MKKSLKHTLIIFAVALGATFGIVRHVQATITINPTLVLIEGRDRFADVNVINSSTKNNNYAILWQYFKQIEDTGLYETTEASTTEWDLAKHLVYTPRRFSLKAKDLQKVRLAVRLNGEPPAPGDYRAHFLVQETGETVDTSQAPAKGAKAVVSLNVGFSIPVIYRSGVSDATAIMGNITTAVTDKGQIEVSVPVEKKGGPFSLLGVINIYHNDQLVGELNNANIFSEISNRTFKVTLNTKELSGGQLRVVYKDFNKKKEIILAEKAIAISK